MESTRPIRALIRGLDALTVLNQRDGATVSEIAQEIRLPRTTVYRILETLSAGGFVIRDAADDRYRLTLRVRGLSDGFDDEVWVTRVATPLIAELGRAIVWPVALSTRSDAHMIVRSATDHETPLAIERYSAGHRAPLLTTAAGRAYLAFCPAAERATLMDTLARDHRPELERLLTEIAARGYATTTRNRRLVEEATLSVPVVDTGGVLAALTVRFVTSSLPLTAGVERFFPQLRACAAKITDLVAEQRSEARTQVAPEVAA